MHIASIPSLFQWQRKAQKEDEEALVAVRTEIEALEAEGIADILRCRFPGATQLVLRDRLTLVIDVRENEETFRHAFVKILKGPGPRGEVFSRYFLLGCNVLQ